MPFERVVPVAALAAVVVVVVLVVVVLVVVVVVLVSSSNTRKRLETYSPTPRPVKWHPPLGGDVSACGKQPFCQEPGNKQCSTLDMM